jgi:protein TonB
MPSSRRASSPRTFDLAAWLPSPKVLLWMLLAFAVGVLLFGVVWLAGREDGGESAPQVPAAATESDYQPLPMPLPARGDERRIEPPRASEPADAPQAELVESTAPPPPSMPPSEPLPQQTAPVAEGAYVSPQPIPGQTPSPRYPPRALRRGESGTVTIRAEIGADGVPISTSVEQSSGSRVLDRAAEEAVRRWRFQPALRDGQPTTGSVVVPISFNPG